MDNNNNQPQPADTPAEQNQQPPVQQPPVQQQPVQNQPVQDQPVQQPMNQQPMNQQQPMVAPRKQPMDSAKKKKLIVWISVGTAVLVLGIAALIIIPILLRIDYGPAYAAVEELEPKIYDIYRSHDCGYVVDYVDSSYTTQKTYNEYIEKCKAVYDSSIDDLIANLENTEGVKRNNEIGTQFTKFKAEYTALQIGDANALSEKLVLWQAEHDFAYTSGSLRHTQSSDAEFTTAANYLINSGNDTLKSYGEGWLERSLAVSAAYRAYRAASWQESSQLYNEYRNKSAEKDDWVATNKPDINAIAPLNFNDTSKVNTEFNKLHDIIAATYAENYNFGSGDCTEFLGEVYCD